MNGADVLATPAAVQYTQFQTLQQQVRQREPVAAVLTARALLTSSLEPLQRALVLQLQGEALRAQGERAAAERVWSQSLALRFSPQVAFGLAELSLLPVVRWGDQQRWLPLLGQLLQHGDGSDLLRWLLHVLAEYPLQQQRQQLLDALEQHQRPLLLANPGLSARWRRLRRCVGSLGVAGGPC